MRIVRLYHQPRTRVTAQQGYTLIELLLYVAILGSLLLSVSLYFVLTAEARVKSQSIAEVESQGAQLMETITQSIRNADSITSPTAGNTTPGLTLAMPTAGVNPTVFSSTGGGGGTVVMGYDQDGGTTTELAGNSMNATKFVASASGTTTTLYALVEGSVGLSPNNRSQMAIYSGASNPSTLLASSSAKILTANSWNAFTIASTAITAGQTYWLVYNTNTAASNENNIRFHVGTVGQARFQSQTYNTWPASWTGATQSIEYSVYADVVSTGGSGTPRIQEGVGGTVDLLNSKVTLTNISFTNLTRSGTPGTVQVRFTISRLNPGNRNEYDYQKDFMTTVSIRQ